LLGQELNGAHYWMLQRRLEACRAERPKPLILTFVVTTKAGNPSKNSSHADIPSIAPQERTRATVRELRAMGQ
ncbi:MAG: hypothetical protein L0387_45940, partial [Acidobacteria bacterium]|nr:hypothetical protein [Acidobacteriota bacterium]